MRSVWPDEPNKAAQKDTNARWTLKIGSKVRCRPDGTPLPQIRYLCSATSPIVETMRTSVSA